MGWIGKYWLERVGRRSFRRDRKRCRRVCTEGEGRDTESDTDGEAKGVAEALEGIVGHVTRATGVSYQGVNPLGRGVVAIRNQVAGGCRRSRRLATG